MKTNPIKTISNKDKFKGNPRQITSKQFGLLKEHIEEFGDLSGVVYCHRNKAFVGGNQRSEIFDGAEIEITESFDPPTKNHTIAHGFIIYKGEKYTYRIVDFTEDQFRKACIVANSDGGSFDWELIANEWPEAVEWGVILPVFIAEDEAEPKEKERK